MAVKKEMDRELIQEAMDALELVDIYVNSSRIIRHQYDIFHDAFPEKMEQQDKITVEGYCLESNSSESEPEIIRAKIKLGSRFIERDNEDNTIIELAEIEAEFVAEYIVNGDVSESALKEFIRFNAVHNVWPFWREFAFKSASEARLPRPIIPLMKNGKKNIK